MSAHTDADVQAASESLHTNWGTDPKAPPADCDWAARLILDAVAPAISNRAAVRALRDYADIVKGRPFGAPHYWQRHEQLAIVREILARADEIEAGS